MNLHFFFSFFLRSPQTPAQADTPLVQPQRDSRAVLGQKTVPNQFRGSEPRSDGLQRERRLLDPLCCHCVRSFLVLNAFGWLFPAPGGRMLLGSGGGGSVSLSCHRALSPPVRRVPARRLLPTAPSQSQPPRHKGPAGCSQHRAGTWAQERVFWGLLAASSPVPRQAAPGVEQTLGGNK